jgi:hypothetical protein
MFGEMLAGFLVLAQGALVCFILVLILFSIMA